MSGTTLEDRIATLSPAETAAQLGVSPGTLANWRCAGTGPRAVKVGGRVRYRVLDLAEYLERPACPEVGDAAEAEPAEVGA